MKDIQTSGHLIINNKSIYYEFVNKGLLSDSKPVLIFLHEGLGSSEQWKTIPVNMSNTLGLPVLMYDRYGYAKSEQINEKRPSNFLEIEAVDWLPKIIAALGISKNPKIIIGHSDGATIALLYAANFPNNTKGVISEAAHVFLDDISISGLKSVRNAYINGNLHSKLVKYHGDKTESMFYAWLNTWLAEEYKDWNIEQCLKNITCPVLAIQGTEDNYGTARQVYSIQENISGRAEILLIENCGHIPHHENRELVEKKMIKFIQNL